MPRLDAARIELWQNSGGNFINRIGLVLINLYSAIGVINGTLTLGDFTITAAISAQLYFHVHQILEFANNLQDTRGAIRRADEIRNVPAEEITADGLTFELDEVDGIHVRELIFSYPGSRRNALSHIDFFAPTGSMTAIVGPSGSGKSTILKLLLQLYQPNGGSIYIGQHSLTELPASIWRENVGAVMQDGSLFSLISLGLLLLWIGPILFIIFSISSSTYLFWIIFLGRRRRAIDTAKFQDSARSRSTEIGLIGAIQDIKIACIEEKSLQEWEKIQVSAFNTRLDAARIELWQNSGGNFINRIGLVLINLYSAIGVINGTLTLGDFTITAAISAQLYFHVHQILEFANNLQDTRGAIRRADEIRNVPAEEITADGLTFELDEVDGIHVRELIFSYPGSRRNALSHIDFFAPTGSMTAIVGPSG